jgi:hypothetical protein
MSKAAVRAVAANSPFVPVFRVRALRGSGLPELAARDQRGEGYWKAQIHPYCTMREGRLYIASDIGSARFFMMTMISLREQFETRPDPAER